ncbi:MAG: Maff2 family protein [Oscillospiraceae bacterium]|nr:Maff2 family protein [Oscillospiraceae bacterium]
MKTGLMAVISITGAGLAVFGVIHLIEAQASTDPNAKSTAIKQLAGGLGLVIVGAIMIPIFIDSITF